MRFDVFNGDADGICALHQLRLAEPAEATLVTGLKHEIALLERVDAGPDDRVTVLDLSLDRNRAALLRLLDRGVHVRYFDHHHAGEVPVHPRLEATLDATGLSCTSELVDRFLGGRFRAWAVVAAYGDNFHDAAARLAASLGLRPPQLESLRTLGENLNYNAYGTLPTDVLIAPMELYRIVSRYADPFELIEAEPLLSRLGCERLADLALARGVPARRMSSGAEAVVLPDAPWSRRVLGTFANRRATEDPGRAHAVLAPLPGGDAYVASLRAPRGCAPSAVDFCRRYPGGGGRATAAGVEGLDAAQLEAFLAAFAAAYIGPA
jgi:hypothetical protein